MRFGQSQSLSSVKYKKHNYILNYFINRLKVTINIKA